jgi:hypothetical protein
MMTRLSFALLFSVGIIACGGDGGTGPSSSAVLQAIGPTTIARNPNSTNVTTSLRNVGSGCATNIGVIFRFYNVTTRAQLGPDVVMVGRDINLRSVIVLPGDRVVLDGQTPLLIFEYTYDVFPTWDSRRCP